MKKIFCLTLLTISISGIAASQVITFDKTLYSTGESYSNIATQVIQDYDGGYILNCYHNLKFIKTDQYGYIQWIKEYPEISNPGYEIRRTFDGGFIAVGSKLNNGISDACLIKLDNNLDTVWTRTYGKADSSEQGASVIQLPDSTFLFSFYINWGVTIHKVDINGNVLLSKNLAGGASFTYRMYLQNLNDGNFLFWKASELYKMDANLNIIWTSIGSSSFAKSTTDNSILTGSRTTFKKLDPNGNILWEKNIENCRSMVELSNGNYLLLIDQSILLTRPCKIIQTDTSGTFLSEIQFDFSGKNLAITQDGGLAISGVIDYNYYWANALYAPWILKTDQNFNYTAVNLIAPADGLDLKMFIDFQIVWHSNNVNYVNIDYSVDNQITWENIISYYPADADTFLWTVPELPAGDIYIRISDSFNPDIYDRSDPPQKTGYRSYDYIAANEIKMWMSNNGSNSHDPRTDWPGFFWPGGEDATISAIFQDGLVWGGKVNGEIRVNGSTYRYGLTPGYILPNGLPSDPNHIKSKIFKLKKNWQYLPPGVERSKYEFDYVNWPVDVGAPWDDKNGDGVYTLGIDEPKILGEETLFFVANDLDTIRSLYTYGSNPIGLEFQVTTFGYNSELLKDVVFKKYKVINKSSTDVTDMYFTYWADDDLGNASDDLSAFDSTYNMAYVYNYDDDDEFYYGTPPPAVAHIIVQGPIIPATFSDSARFDNGWRKGFKNLGMTSSGLIVKNSFIYPRDPSQGVYEGTLEFYNLMQGLRNDGSYIIDPNTNQPTIWPITGDPVTQTGWYQVSYYPRGGDQRYHAPTGPFNLAVGDTQEIVIAFLIQKGTDNLNSITKLRNYAAQIQHWYDNDFVTDVDETTPTIPTEFSLSQNYPNPFNPSTTIKYAISSKQLVQLKVYDILGNEIATLVNEEKPAGNYKVEFKSTVGSLQLASGIYFYRLKAGSFVETKKMILIK